MALSLDMGNHRAFLAVSWAGFLSLKIPAGLVHSNSDCYSQNAYPETLLTKSEISHHWSSSLEHLEFVVISILFPSLKI